MRLPVIHSGVSLAIHVAIVYGLLQYTDLGIYGLIIGNVSFPIIVSLMNMRSVRVKLEHRWNVRRTFALPLAASLVMGAVALFFYKLIAAVLPFNAAALFVSIVAAVFTYGYLILKLNCFTRQELLERPMGCLLYTSRCV